MSRILTLSAVNNGVCTFTTSDGLIRLSFQFSQWRSMGAPVQIRVDVEVAP